jgi:O-antigen/teichoic acid export membrane protein
LGWSSGGPGATERLVAVLVLSSTGWTPVANRMPVWSNGAHLGLTKTTILLRRLSASWDIARVVALLFGSVGAAVLAFGTQLVLTRVLPITEYGRLAAVLAVINVLQVFSGYGTGWFWLQLFGHEGRAAFRWVRPTLCVMTAASAAGVLLLIAYVYLGDASLLGGSSLTILSLVAVLLGQTLAETTSARLQLEERFLGLAIWQTLSQFGRFLVVGLVFFYQTPDLPHVIAAYAAVALVMSAVSAASLHEMCRKRIRLAGHNMNAPPVEPSDAATLGTAFLGATPYCFSTFFYLFYSQGVVAVTERLAGPTAAATYNAAFLVIAAVYLMPSVLYTKYLVGKLFRWWTHDRVRFATAISIGVIFGSAVGVVCMLIIIGSASFIVLHLFGPQYAAAAPILMLLATGIPIRFIQHAYGAAFFSRENMKRKVRYIGIAALCSVFVSLLLIPSMGAMGAACSAVLAELVLLLLYALGVARHVQGVDLRTTFSFAGVRDAVAYVQRSGERGDREPQTAFEVRRPHDIGAGR